MTPQAVLAELLNRLEASRGAAVLVGSEELREWPAATVAALKSVRLLVQARPVHRLTCPGCEKQCSKDVDLFPAEGARPARAYIHCDEPEDMGRITVEPAALEYWRITGDLLASAIARLLGITKPPAAGESGTTWALGSLPGRESKGGIAFSIENGGALSLAGQRIPLAEVLTLGVSVKADKDAFLRAVDGDGKQPSAGIGSPAWRKQQAKAAADALHSKPGGSRDVREQMRAIWASGKYTSRDRCAEEECGALGISYSTARKALRNTPEPQRT
jgi:hypothetical protein